MVDYTRATGSSGTMMIRDHGGWVEFWLKAGSATFNNQLPWSYTANGAHSGWLTYRFVSGGNWQHLGSVYVSTRQTVTFHLGATGTAGLGGPTDLSVFLERATVPPAPSLHWATAVSSSEVDVHFTGNGDGGSGVLEWQIGYGTDPNGPQHFAGSGGTTRIGNLAAGTTWYFWARGRNALGWGGWSNRGAATTWRVPDAPSSPVLSLIKQTSLTAKFTGNGNGGTGVLEWQLGYGTSSASPTTTVSSTGTTALTGLSPGAKYYFWARGRNAVGWGPWSARSEATLIAGAHVKVGAVWKRAVPYVNVNGVWKVARPWAKIAGIWKETAS